MILGFPILERPPPPYWCLLQWGHDFPVAGLSPMRQRRQSRVPRQVRQSEYKRKEQERRRQGQHKPRRSEAKQSSLPCQVYSLAMLMQFLFLLLNGLNWDISSKRESPNSRSSSHSSLQEVYHNYWRWIALYASGFFERRLCKGCWVVWETSRVEWLPGWG